jgi:hypothetical protein
MAVTSKRDQMNLRGESHRDDALLFFLEAAHHMRLRRKKKLAIGYFSG